MLDQKQRLDNLNSDLNNLWNPTKTQLEMQMVDVALVRNFFDKWIEYINKGESNKDAYKDALKTLPKDNPATTNFNEAITEDQLKDKVQFLFGKPLFSNNLNSNSHVNTDDVKALKEDMDFLKSKVRYFYAMTNLADGEMRRIQIEIDSINAAVKAASEDDSGDGGDDSMPNLVS